MAALVVVTMGVFSSCKDYDDDINAHGLAINSLTKQVEDLNKAAAAAQATADAAKADAAKAQAAADAAQKTADEALAAGKQGIADAAKAQAAADAAQAAADEAKAAAAQAKADALKALAEEAARLDAAIAKKADQEYVEAEIAKLATKEELQKAIDTFDKALADQFTVLDGKITTLDGKVDAINAALKAAIDECVKKDAFDAAIAGLDQQIKALQGKDEELATLIATNHQESLDKISSLTQFVTELKAQVDANEKAIDALQKALPNYATLDYVNGTFKDQITAAYIEYIKGITDPMQEQLDGAIQDIATNGANITDLQGRMDAVEAYITNLKEDIIPGLEAAIALKADKTDVDRNTANIAKLFAALKYVDENNNAITDIYGKLATVNDEIQDLKDADQGLSDRITALEEYKAQLIERLKGMSDSIKTNADNIATLTRTVNELKEKVETLEKNVLAIINFTNKNITSLVTKPSYWTYGFPTIEATIIEAQPTYEFKKGQGAELGKTVNKYSENVAPIGGANNPTLSGYAFDMTANYWVNPSTVGKDFLKDNYTYWFDEVAAKNYITRGNEDTDTAGFKYVRFEKYEKGVLTVKFQFKDGKNVNNALTKYEPKNLLFNGQEDDMEGITGTTPSYAWTTTIALRATRTNTDEENAAKIDDKRIVTSDYAIVVPTYLNNLILGNNEYEGEHADEGNQEWHLNTTYQGAVDDDAEGLYSFVINRDEAETVIDFNDYIDVHYNGCDDVWDNAKAQELGFEFVYTLLTNTDVWKLDGSEISILEGKNVAENTGENKAAIVRVELVADGKTYAYGYVTVLMENTSLDVEVETELTLNCEYDEQGNLLPFTASASWDALIAKIKEGLGQDIDWTLCDFVAEEVDPEAEAPNAGPYVKYDEKTSTNASTKLVGEILHVDDELAWQFDEEAVMTAFYTDGAPNNAANYAAWIRIVPNEAGNAQGFAQINIKLTITKVTYPSGTFSEDGSDRIKSNWFKMFSNEKTEVAAERYEIHVNDEAPGETGANNEIKYDVTSAFVKNTFKFTADAGFDIDEEADLFFNAARYFIYNGTNGTAWSATADYILTGAHGNQYVMYLLDPAVLGEDETPYTVLYAALITNGRADFSSAEDNVVAVLSGEHNEVVEFQTTDNAKDLLNHARHDELGENETFTSHMIMHTVGNCLPVDERGMNTFDIRYLRPISANVAGQKKVWDAKDDGNKIWVADLVSFIDWRKHEFAASTATVKVPAGQPTTSWTGYQYLDYYGITTIKADFDQARSNVHTGTLDQILDADGKVVNPTAWLTIKEITSKINFTPDANAQAIIDGATADQNTDAWTADYSVTYDEVNKLYTKGFKAANGYYLYENNSGGTTDFYIILPVSVVYYWGETQPEWILIEVKGTEGQGNHSRR